MYSSEELLHAVDLAMIQDLDGAKAIFEGIDDPLAGRLLLFIQDLEQRKTARRSAFASLRHEIGNALSIAQANLEGIIDGVLTPDPERLAGIQEALNAAGKLLDKMKHVPERALSTRIEIETFDIYSLVAMQYATVVGPASAKDVRMVFEPALHPNTPVGQYRGDVSRIAQIVRNVFATTIRYTRPGGTIRITCDAAGAILNISVSDSSLGVTADLLRSLGPEVRMLSQQPNGVTFAVDLPAVPMPA
ncbi:MAG: sensor histidine kinase [Vulcanimicrobiaceae bacterium]